MTWEPLFTQLGQVELVFILLVGFFKEGKGSEYRDKFEFNGSTELLIVAYFQQNFDDEFPQEVHDAESNQWE